MEADPTEVRTSAKPLEAVKQESRDNQAVTTPGKTAQEEVGTSKGASSSGQENPGQTGVEPEQGEYWQYSQEEWEQWEKEKQAYRRTHRQWRKSDEDLYAQRRRPGKREREALKRKAESMEASETGRSAAVTAAASSPARSESKNLGRGAANRGKA